MSWDRQRFVEWTILIFTETFYKLFRGWIILKQIKNYSRYFSFSKTVVHLYYNSDHVRSALNFWFQNECIVSSRPIAWPSTSPGMTPLKFFVGWVKIHISYSKKMQNNNLWKGIVAAFRSFTPDMLAKTWEVGRTWLSFECMCRSIRSTFIRNK